MSYIGTQCRKETTLDHNVIFRRAVSEGVLHVRKRASAIAHQATCGGASDEVVAGIICRNVDYMSRSMGRRLQGVPKPTCKARDHKARKGARVRHIIAQHAHTVDLCRTYTDRSAPFRQGGCVWSKVNRGKKNRFRAILHKADAFYSAGEITVALELLRAL